MTFYEFDSYLTIVLMGVKWMWEIFFDIWKIVKENIGSLLKWNFQYKDFKGTSFVIL
jgi:hypothetical protein